MKTPALALPLVVLATVFPARAEVGGQIDADLDLGFPMVDIPAPALAVGGRFGWRFDPGPVWIQPEVGGSYTGFFFHRCDGCLPANHASRILGGLRFGGAGLISGVIEPALFGHAGYGWAQVIRSGRGPAFDLGFALDVKAVRHFHFGVHGAYNVVMSSVDVVSGASAPATVRWLSYGVHLGAAF
jgi:hypothetical protein